MVLFIFNSSLFNQYLLHNPPLQFTFWSLLALGCAFLITSFDATGACYVVPCASGEMRALYRVSGGSSFQLVLTGISFVVQPCYGLAFLRARCTELVAGGYICGSIINVIMALVNVVLWGGEADKMQSIVIYGRMGHNITPNHTLRTSFSALTCFSSLIFIVGLANVFFLVYGREYYSEHDPYFGGSVGAYPAHYQKGAREEARIDSRKQRSVNVSPPSTRLASASSPDLSRRKPFAYSYQNSAPPALNESRPGISSPLLGGESSDLSYLEEDVI